jgi:hypothetical protein
MECKKCKSENQNGNFCTNCGTKLKKECSYCWIKKEPYNCGERRCPSYRLYKKIIHQK